MYKNKDINLMDLQIPTCEALKHKWIKDFCVESTHKDFDKCPVPAVSIVHLFRFK